jgi:hypothetical protein
MNHRLPRAQPKSDATNKIGPNTELLGSGSEDNVVAINANRHMFSEHPAEGSIVLEAEKGKTQEIPHQLPHNLLKGLLAIVVEYPRPKRPQSGSAQGRRNPTRIVEGNLQGHLRNLHREIIRGGFVIAGHEHLSFHRVKLPELTGFSLPSQQPGKLAHPVVQGLVEGSQNPLLGTGNGDHAILAALRDDVEPHIPRNREWVPALSKAGAKESRTILTREGAGAPLSFPILQAGRN